MIIAAVGHVTDGRIASLQNGAMSYGATGGHSISTSPNSTPNDTGDTASSAATGTTGTGTGVIPQSAAPTSSTTTFDYSSAEMSSNYTADPSQCGPSPPDNGQPFRPNHVYQVTATVHVWSEPDTSSTPLAEIVSTSYGGGVFGCPSPADPTVLVACTVTGQPISGPYGTERFWDQVTHNGATGYVPDEWVNTQYDVNHLPSC